MLLCQKFLYGKRDSRHCVTQLAIFRNQRGIEALRQRDVLRIITGDGVFRRHSKRRIYRYFALGNFYEAGDVVAICDHLFGPVLKLMKVNLLVMVHHRLILKPV